MQSRRFGRPAFGAALCAAVLLSSACFGGQPAAQATPTSAPAGVPSPSTSPATLPSPSPLASPVASPSATQASGPEQTYTVDNGDTLAIISQKVYGDPTLWRKIYDANRASIGDDPDKLKVGTQLRIPPKD